MKLILLEKWSTYLAILAASSGGGGGSSWAIFNFWPGSGLQKYINFHLQGPSLIRFQGFVSSEGAESTETLDGNFRTTLYLDVFVSLMKIPGFL